MKRICQWLTIDLRALAAMRIGLGLLILWDLADRAQYLVEFYTDAGACPRWLYSVGGAQFQSLYFLDGSTAFAGAMFALHAVFAIMLTLGYRTRVATIACLIMTWSLTSRNMIVCTGGDNVIVWLLVWSIFLPIGAVMSLDARKTNDPNRPRAIFSIATTALLIQVVLLYASAAAAKSHPGWTRELSAVHYFLNSQLGTPLGHAIAKSPVITSVLTALAMVLEIFGPLLALVSAPLPALRAVIVVTFIFFHVALGATLYVGSFAFACVVAWLPFLPTPAWDLLFRTSHDRRNAALSPSWRAPDKFARAVIIALLAYIALLSALTILPVRVTRFAGPLARLPRLRQNWTVMGTPPPVATRLSAEATLADGEQVTLIDTASPPARGFIDYLWPPGNARVLKFQTSMLNGATRGELDAPRAYCDLAMRRWNTAHHDLMHRALRVQLFVNYYEIPSIDLPDIPGEEGRRVLAEFANGANR